MPGDPGGVFVFQWPALDQVEHPVGMVLGDVVEVIGHRLAHIRAGVGLEIVENGGGECRVGLDSFQAK
ncbi:hypothetical protein D3C84_881820 [compost metagenome]